VNPMPIFRVMEHSRITHNYSSVTAWIVCPQGAVGRTWNFDWFKTSVFGYRGDCAEHFAELKV
jgi:hypothetical protein